MDWALRSVAKMGPEKPEVGETPGGMMNHTTDSTSAPYCFISYCRQEVTFADSFSRELEKRGIHTWVDFRNLVPGHEWQSQLDDAVKNAAAILLVVSKASMSSLPVKDEWIKSLAAGKRIILIIFEPCKLDPSLIGLEWVDFTKNFNKALDQLIACLADSSRKGTSLPPQKWKRLPGAAIKFMLLSYPLAGMSLAGGILSILIAIPWGIYIPILKGPVLGGIISFSILYIWLPSFWNFAWLPGKIYKRTHNAQKIRNGLNGLLYSSLLLSILQLLLFVPFVQTEAEMPSQVAELIQTTRPYSFSLFLIIIITCSYLNRLLLSDAMYRWAGPQGTLIRIVPPDITAHMENGPSMRVAIDYAPQDRLYAEELKASITKAGHICTDDLQDADLVLTLLSKFKTNSECDPETTRLIPILIQDCDVEKQLSQLQWIDLRYGRASMDALANLLDQPDELLRILGVLPVRTTILPYAVRWLALLLSTLMIISIFSVLPAIAWTGVGVALLLAVQAMQLEMEAPALPSTHQMILEMIALFIVPPGIYLLRQFVIKRRLKYVPFLSHWWAFGLAAVLAALYASQNGLQDSLLFWLVLLLMLHKDVRLWFPVRAKKRVRDSQRSEVQPATSQ